MNEAIVVLKVQYNKKVIIVVISSAMLQILLLIPWANQIWTFIVVAGT